MRTMFKTLVLLLVANLTFAQINIGVRGGVSASKTSKFPLLENIAPDFKFMPAPAGAFFAELPITDRFSIQPELAFTQKGFTTNGALNINTDNLLGIDIPLGGRLTLRNTYLEVPILAKIKLGDPEMGHAYFLVGPSVGYMVSSKTIIRVLNLFPIRTSLASGLFHNAEFSGVAALGYEFPLGDGGKFFMEGRYQQGISRIINVPILQLPVRNQTFGFNIGASFPLNRSGRIKSSQI